MQIYLVGGAVRDQLLGLPVKERDWVVVGATPEQMLAQGYRPVGKDFPVFLHPTTHEEYALARTERKTGHGYAGFSFYTSPDVTLEEDLKRRDFTVNAMAMTPEGQLVDPFGGQADLQAKVFRHVSPAFVEDPVRILRAARFMAGFASLGFHVAFPTLLLMREMVYHGEVDHLVPERVWQELSRALHTHNPQQFLIVLRQCGALARVFPEIDHLFGVPASKESHPEIDTGIHTLMVLEQAALLAEDAIVRFAAMLHDLGKAQTDPQHWPKHVNHETAGLSLVKQFCQRIKVPKEFKELALLVCKYHGVCHKIQELKPAELIALLEALDAFRRPQRFSQFLLACEADSRGRLSYSDEAYPQAEWLQKVFNIADEVDVQPILKEGYQGKDLADELRKRRVTAIAGQCRLG